MALSIELLKDDLAGRWRAGEVGCRVLYDGGKYDVALLFGSSRVTLFDRPILASRVYFFYKDEVAPILNVREV